VGTRSTYRSHKRVPRRSSSNGTLAADPGWVNSGARSPPALRPLHAQPPQRGALSPGRSRLSGWSTAVLRCVGFVSAEWSAVAVGTYAEMAPRLAEPVLLGLAVPASAAASNADHHPTAEQTSGAAVRVPYRSRWEESPAGRQEAIRVHAKIRARGHHPIDGDSERAR